MSVQDRPFVGTWEPEKLSIVQHTPDALVYVNGFTDALGCPYCDGKIDIQKYITSVSCDPNTEPIANATISLSIPGTAFRTDGSFFLRPGLEVTIYMRGYFARKILTQDDSVEGVDPSDTPVYPYYQVFNGVITEASYEYSGGEYSASISCSDVLHFWSNLKMSTNGAVFGKRPSDALTEPTLNGHTFMGASPYSIIYTLFRVGFGAAGGIDFQLAKKTNVNASSEVSNQSLYKMAALWWESKWASNSISLRMFGTDGKLFNAFEQAYLGIFSGKKPEALKKVMDQNKDLYPYDKNSSARINKLVRDLGYNPLSTQIAVTISEDGKKKTKIDATKQQAFNLDISALGNVNLFETEYMSKLDIVNAVRLITGYEFFQDVTGDLIFKPPFYNLDTSDDPVYVIEDRDLISLSQAEREPQATMIKGSGSHFTNVSGVGLDNWLGLGALYVDYRLVAQFGWREETFECNYLSDTRALFVSAMNRLDLVNIGCKSASITIPLRPELRPGYPVYIRSLDCFYYIQSMSHSFTYGAQCTTTINGVGKRGKFNAPGKVQTGRAPTIDDIDLSNPYLPEVPLIIKPEQVYQGDGVQSSSSGPPRIQGFPNVVLAIDPALVNPDSLVYLSKLTADQVVVGALDLGVLQVSTEAVGSSMAEKRYNGPYQIPNEEDSFIQITKADIQKNWAEVQTALREGKQLSDVTGVSEEFTALFSAIQTARGVPDDQNLINYLILMKDQKAAYNPGAQISGTYRYYSASHPDGNFAGYQPIYADQTTGKVDQKAQETAIADKQIYGFYRSGSSFKYGPMTPYAGLNVIQYDNTADGSVTTVEKIVPTSDIRFVTFTSHTTNADTSVQQDKSGFEYGASYRLPSSSDLTKIYREKWEPVGKQTDASKSIKDRYLSFWSTQCDLLRELITGAIGTLGFLTVDPLLQPGLEDITGSSSGQLEAFQNEAFFTRILSSVNGSDGNALDLTKTVSENFTVGASPATSANAENIGNGVIFDALSAGLSQLYVLTLEVIYSNAVSLTPPKWVPLYKQRDDLLTKLFSNTKGTPPPSPIPRVKKTKAKQKEQKAFTPVFPVSDARGYEVVGSLPYGRGLNVETYEALAAYAARVSTNGTTVTVESLLGGGSASLTTFRAVEEFLIRYASTGDVAKALGGMNPQSRSAVEGVFLADSALESTSSQGSEVPQITAGSIEAVRNIIAASNSQGQKTLAQNVPLELAQISVENPEDSCTCVLQSAQTYLLAASGAFSGTGEAEVVDFLISEAESVTESWSYTKEALSGKVLDRRNSNLAEEFNRTFAQTGSPNFLGGALSRTQAEIQNINDAVAVAEAALQDPFGTEG